MKLSVVTMGRNDDYDGNFNDRLAYALGMNMNRLPPDTEFIFVEWNPIPNKPLVCDALRKVFGYRVRYYVAHPKFHPQYCTIYSFIEYPAKNIGIRRASGDYIISVNSDVIFDPDVVDKLSKMELKNGVLYRAVRVDIRFDYFHVQFPLEYKYMISKHTGLYDGCGDFVCMDKGSWHNARGYCEAFPEQRLHKDSFLIWQLVECNLMPVEWLGRITHWSHPSSWVNGFNRSDVGDVKWDFKKSGFIRNVDTWGLLDAQEVSRDGITWLE